VGFSIHPDDAGPEREKVKGASGWRVREEVTTSKAAAAAASLLALFWMCVWNTTKYTTRHLRLSLFFSPSIVAVRGIGEGGTDCLFYRSFCVSLILCFLLSSLILFSSLIAQQSTTPNQGHFKGIERRRKWKEDEEDEQGEKENSPRGQRKKEISSTNNTHTHIHSIEKERKGINESPTKSSGTHGLDYWWALAKLPDATPGARARSEVEVVY